MKTWTRISLALVAFLLAYKTVSDLDFWWHLAAGRWMWEHKQIVTQDPFSYTATGLPWLSITWGYEILIYALSVLGGGMWLVTAFHALLAAGTTLFAWLTWEKLVPRNRTPIERLLAMMVFLAGLSLVELRWINRPEIFTYFCGAVILFLLVARNRIHQRWFYAVPLVQILWVNTHGIFIFGPILVALFLGADLIQHRKWKVLAPILGLTLLACFLNPRGWQGAIWPFHLLDALRNEFFQRTIPEVTRPFRDVEWGYDTWGLAIWGAMLAGTAVIGPRRYGWAFFILAPALFWTSVNARRNIALLVIWTLPFVADLVSAFVLTRGSKWMRGLNQRRVTGATAAALPLVLAVLVVTNLYRSPYSVTRFGGEVTPHHFPEGARVFLESLQKERGRQGEIFANVEFSDYMLFRLPGYRPYIDSRFAELYSVEHFKRYMDILAHPQLIHEEAKRRGIEIVGISHNGPMSKGIVTHLATHPDWRVGYYDETAIVFLKKNLFPIQKSQDSTIASEYQKAQWEFTWLEKLNLRRWMHDVPRPFVQLAQVQAMIGELDFALRSVETALARNPEHAEALGSKCIIQFLVSSKKENFTDDVELTCQNALRAGASRAATYQVLGLTYLNTGRAAQAIQAFQKVIQADPISFEGTLMLGYAYSAMGGDPRYMELAGRAFQEAARLRPYEPDPVIQMNRLQMAPRAPAGK